MEFSSKEVRAALGTLDLERLETAVRHMRADEVPLLIAAIRESGCLLVRQPRKEMEARRDSILLRCRQLVQELSGEHALDELDTHSSHARAAEFGFRELHRTLKEAPISSYS